MGKVKVIYIDPPYNTGTDFVYEDDFSESASDYLKHSGQFDENGNRLFYNTEVNGRFHTDWLNMIYPRLKLAKDLLHDEGIIFISIDDKELTNMRKICDEIFSKVNFMSCIAVKMSEASGVKMTHAKIKPPKLKEYVLMYKKTSSAIINPVKIPKKQWDNEYRTILLGVTKDEMERINQITYLDNRSKEDEFLVETVLKKGNSMTLSDYFKKENIVTEKEKYTFKVENAYRIFQVTATSTTFTEKIKDYITINKISSEFFSYITPQKELYIIKNPYDNPSKKPRLQVLFASNYLEYNPGDFWTDIKTTGLDNEGGVPYKNGKKPISLVKRLLGMIEDKNCLILDFFSGSATTSEVVMQLNAQDNGNRKYIMVQLRENLDDSYKTSVGDAKKQIKESLKFLDDINRPHFLSELGKERIRRAGIKIKEEAGLTADSLDTGFRVLRLDSSNMKDVYYNPSEYQANIFNSLTNNIKEDRTPEDLLFQVMLDLGVLLSSKIEEIVIKGKTVFNVDNGYLMACFDENVDEEIIKTIAQEKPYYFVMRDSSMANDSVATNFEQIFATYSPDTVRKVL